MRLPANAVEEQRADREHQRGEDTGAARCDRGEHVTSFRGSPIIMDDDGVRTAVIVVRDIRGGYEFHGLPSLAIV